MHSPYLRDGVSSEVCSGSKPGKARIEQNGSA